MCCFLYPCFLVNLLCVDVCAWFCVVCRVIVFMCCFRVGWVLVFNVCSWGYIYLVVVIVSESKTGISLSVKKKYVFLLSENLMVTHPGTDFPQRSLTSISGFLESYRYVIWQADSKRVGYMIWYIGTVRNYVIIDGHPSSDSLQAPMLNHTNRY